MLLRLDYPYHLDNRRRRRKVVDDTHHLKKIPLLLSWLSFFRSSNTAQGVINYLLLYRRKKTRINDV
jgi:hypothetical protein